MVKKNTKGGNFRLWLSSTVFLYYTLNICTCTFHPRVKGSSEDIWPASLKTLTFSFLFPGYLQDICDYKAFSWQKLNWGESEFPAWIGLSRCVFVLPLQEGSASCWLRRYLLCLLLHIRRGLLLQMFGNRTTLPTAALSCFHYKHFDLSLCQLICFMICCCNNLCIIWAFYCYPPVTVSSDCSCFTGLGPRAVRPVQKILVFCWITSKKKTKREKM